MMELRISEMPGNCKPSVHSECNYGENLAKDLLELQRNNKWCDTIVDVEGRKYPAHKCVLAASSPYFASILLEQV